jgi:hypothetical protein
VSWFTKKLSSSLFGLASGHIVDCVSCSSVVLSVGSGSLQDSQMRSGCQGKDLAGVA